jgi:hypothetical protein
VKRNSCEPLSELEQWLKDVCAKWDERLLRHKTMLENEVVAE